MSVLVTRSHARTLPTPSVTVSLRGFRISAAVNSQLEEECCLQSKRCLLVLCLMPFGKCSAY